MFTRRVLSCFIILITPLACVVSADERGIATNAHHGRDTATADQPVDERLGVGFLWPQTSQTVVEKLTRENDFIDLILGPGKLDMFEKVESPVRVICLARSLEKYQSRPFPGVKETIEILRGAKIPPKRLLTTGSTGKTRTLPPDSPTSIQTDAR